MLTAAQKRTLQFIEHYFATHQQAPKLLEVANGIGIQSKGTVSRYIDSLIDAGYLAKSRHRHRGLMLANQATHIALQGKASPFMQFQQCHSMHIKDSSLSEQGFFPGDTIWYQPSEVAKANDVIMAYLDKTIPLIKRVHALEGEFITLGSPHTVDKPRAYALARVSVYGVIKGWMRSYVAVGA